MDAAVARVQARILVGRQVQQVQRVVGPSAAAGGVERVCRVGGAADHEAAGALQADAAVGVAAELVVGGARREDVLGRQELAGVAHGPDERIVAPLLEAEPDRVEARRALQRRDDALDGLAHRRGGGHDAQDLRGNGHEPFKLLARGDVEDGAHQVHGLAALIAPHRRGQLSPHHGPVLRQVPLLIPRRICGARSQQLDLALRLGDVVRMSEVLPPRVPEFLARIAQHLAEGVVDLGFPGELGDRLPHDRMVEDVLELVLALTHRLLGQLELGDVAHHADAACDGVGLASQRSRGH